MNVMTKASPEMTEAMSASDLTDACAALKLTIGAKASVSIVISNTRYHTGDAVGIIVYPAGFGATESFRGATWSEAFAAAYAWAATHKQIRRNNIIRKMALAIISITDEFGECAEARLRAVDFTREEITEFHEAACARASEMCASAPFSVLMEMV
jgi:hypothetical protein